jgi:biopolymer transport protein ExbD
LASWDVFHADSLELDRGLSSDAIRAALLAGGLHHDDLVRPAGTTAAWVRLGDLPELMAPAPAADLDAAVSPATPAPPREPSHRAERPPTVGEAPGRIRAERGDAPSHRAPLSDFEVRAEDPAPTPQREAPSASTMTTPPPAWLQLGGEPDDVTFPVIPGDPADRRTQASPAPSGPALEHGAAGPPVWTWPDDDEEGEAVADGDDAGIVDLDDKIEILDDEAAGLEILDEDDLSVPSPSSREATTSNGASRLALPVVPSRDWNEDRAPVEEIEEEDFTLSRSGPMTVEELDLAPMVDVAFQLVLFFMVTATTVLYKTLEIPKPTNDQAPGAVAQGHSRSVDDLQKDYVLVEIDSGGAIKIDREPVPATVDALAERLRTARDKTGRKIMLLSADYATAHRNAVLAYDAAIDIGMGIAIARPNPPQGPAPSVFPGARRGDATGPAAVATSPPTKASAARPPTPATPAPGDAPF